MKEQHSKFASYRIPEVPIPVSTSITVLGIAQRVHTLERPKSQGPLLQIIITVQFRAISIAILYFFVVSLKLRVDLWLLDLYSIVDSGVILVKPTEKGITKLFI